MVWLISFLSGLIFGIGLLLSGMVNPAKVIGFLDITGTWDPSLAFVMIGAILISVMAFFAARRMRKAVCTDIMDIPTNRRIDKKLILGSILFGAGWGLAGFCPGPAIVGVGALQLKAVIFTLAMLVGFAISKLKCF